MFSSTANECSLEEFMQFFCGCRQEPPSGFEAKPSVHFLAEGRLPTVSTCGLMLSLPPLEDEEKFVEAMVFAILNSPTFNKV